MKKERRWMSTVLKEAARTKIDMPWTRGSRREAIIAKRNAEPQARAARG